jgi:organic hydroperoxide reductase OsmC/OhrA
MTVRRTEATIRWLGHPPEGEPRLTVGSNSLVPALPLNVDPNATHPLATSPGELLAGAIGAAFAYLVAEALVKEGTQASELIAYATLTLSSGADDEADLVLSAIGCHLSGRVASIDQEHLDAVAKVAMTRCVEALGMRAEGIAVTVEASLVGE